MNKSLPLEYNNLSVPSGKHIMDNEKTIESVTEKGT